MKDSLGFVIVIVLVLAIIGWNIGVKKLGEDHMFLIVLAFILAILGFLFP